MDYIDDSNCLEIDLDAIKYNFKEIKNKLSKSILLIDKLVFYITYLISYAKFSTPIE